MAPFERAVVVSYRLSIVAVVLCVTIRPQFAIECLQRSSRVGLIVWDGRTTADRHVHRIAVTVCIALSDKNPAMDTAGNN